jgi:YD repeat-containing protein
VTDPAGHQLVFSYDQSGRLSKVFDPAGNPFVYGYDLFVGGHLISVTYPDAKVRGYLYNETVNTSGANLPFALTGVTDENGGRYATYKYDSSGRAMSSEHAGGADKVTLSYATNTTTVTDALNTSRTYTFQTTLGVAKPSALSQPCGSGCGPSDAAGATYDANGNATSRTDFNGNQTNYAYDLTRNLETVRVEGLTSGGTATTATRTISTQWHPSFRLPVAIAQPKRIATYTYDSQGNLTFRSIQATIDIDGSEGFRAATTGSPRTWAYTNTYSSTIPGLLVRQVVDGPRTDVSDVTTFVWDDSGDLISVTNAVGHMTSITSYDVHGRPLTIIDPNGLITTLAYDLRQRLISRNVGGETTGYTYDAAGQLVQVTLPDGSSLSYTYDAAHRLVSIHDSLGNQIAYTLDAMGNRVKEQVSDPGNALVQTRSRVYNGLNRLVQDIGAASQVTQYGYDNQGNLTSITDPLSHATIQAFDPLNRLVRMIDPNNGQTQYAYDGLDQLSVVTDPRSLVTSYAIDGLGNTTQQISPDTGTTNNVYDAAGNLTSSIDAAGIVTTYSYDALNRLAAAIHMAPAGSGIPTVTIVYDYDRGNNGIGRLTGVTDSTGTISYAYDQKARLIQDTRVIGGVTYVTSYSYDSAGRLVGLTYPGGRQVNYSLDALGRIAQISTSVNSQPQTVLSGATYRPLRRCAGLQLRQHPTLYPRLRSGRAHQRLHAGQPECELRVRCGQPHRLAGQHGDIHHTHSVRLRQLGPTEQLHPGHHQLVLSVRC